MKIVLYTLLLSIFISFNLQAQNITFSIEETAGAAGMFTDCNSKIASFDIFIEIDEPNWELRSYNVWTTYPSPEFNYYDDAALLSIDAGDTDDNTNGQYRVGGANGTTVIAANSLTAFHTIRYGYTDDLDLLNSELTAGGTVLVYGYEFNTTITLVNTITGNSVGLVVTNQASLTLSSQTLSCIGNSPVAVADSYAIDENDQVTIFDVTANDTDADGNINLSSTNIVCSTCNGTSHGTLVNNGNGTFSYTPDANFIGTDNFTYEIVDTYGLTSTALVTITIEPSYLIETQEIIFPVGWRIISTYINPTIPNIVDVFSSVSSNIVMVKNGAGNVYWPGFGINLIGDHVVGEGYKVKMNIVDTLVVTGNVVVPESTPLVLPTYWSYLGYVRTSSAAIEQLLVSIISDVIIVKNSLGLVYWPSMVVNTIGNMNPGEGYQISLSNSTTLAYPANGTISQSTKGLIDNDVQHYNNELNTGSNMTIGIPLSAWDIMPESGDEVAVYNGDNMVGASVFNSDALCITIWGNDKLSSVNEGLKQGTSFAVLLWHKATSTEEVMTVSYWESGSNIYYDDAISVIGKFDSTPLNNLDFNLLQNMPNPFNTTSMVQFSIPVNTNVNLEIYNYLGELIDVVISDYLEAGKHTYILNAGNYRIGTYLIRLRTNSFSQTKTITII